MLDSTAVAIAAVTACATAATVLRGLHMWLRASRTSQPEADPDKTPIEGVPMHLSPQSSGPIEVITGLRDEMNAVRREQAVHATKIGHIEKLVERSDRKLDRLLASDGLR